MKLCYESALRAYETLYNDNHSGLSIEITKNILNRMIDNKPLTPIEDTEDEWILINNSSDTLKEYQCKRISSLFKRIYKDGLIQYTDIDRTLKQDTVINTLWHSGLTDKIIDELFPITMPYMPEDNHYKVICEDYLTDRKNGDYDTIGIFKIIKQNGDIVEINRYFKDGEDNYIEINSNEFEERKKMHYERIKQSSI